MKNRIADFDSAEANARQPGVTRSIGTLRRQSTDNNAWTSTLEHTIGNHPVLAITLGICAGVTLGWLIKRQ